MRTVEDILAELNALDRSHKADYYRPRDASTLLILDRAAGGPTRVLMGRRHVRHRFMPGAWVFPGGRVDPADSRVKPADDYHPAELAKLMVEMKGPKTEARARAIAIAAIRETFEEAGVFVAVPAGKATPAASAEAIDPHDAFAAFAARDLAPALAEIRFVARAITPPGRPRRFDTRFLAIPAEAIAGRLESGLGPSGELEDVAWVTFEEARARPELPPITRAVLDELETRLAGDPRLAADHPVPFYRWRRTEFVRGLIEAA
ncbi:MAG: NUDIX domain-containing protein [Siculibacillus sp.]|nr:NUDIX domain-containing protein [Siculibacillus sp.]